MRRDILPRHPNNVPIHYNSARAWDERPGTAQLPSHLSRMPGRPRQTVRMFPRRTASASPGPNRARGCPS